MKEDHLASSERQPISITDVKRDKELAMARKVLSFHRNWVEIMQGEVARLEMGIVPIQNGVRDITAPTLISRSTDEPKMPLHEVYTHMWDEPGWSDL